MSPERKLETTSRRRWAVLLLRIAAIWRRFPEITSVPAHDARGFADLPTL